jgi:5-methylcytosine-specific restriction protein B
VYTQAIKSFDGPVNAHSPAANPRKYPSASANTPFEGPHEISGLFNKLRSEIADLPSVKANKNLIVKSSYGKGNWATVPWLAIFDTLEISTTQDGTYVVFLFQEEGKGCHLKLAQGVTELTKAMKSKAVDELKRWADEIRERHVSEDAKEFDVSGGPILESKGRLCNLQ